MLRELKHGPHDGKFGESDTIWFAVSLKRSPMFALYRVGDDGRYWFDSYVDQRHLDELNEGTDQ